jgi:hypothetical protein
LPPPPPPPTIPPRSPSPAALECLPPTEFHSQVSPISPSAHSPRSTCRRLSNPAPQMIE